MVLGSGAAVSAQTVQKAPTAQRATASLEAATAQRATAAQPTTSTQPSAGAKAATSTRPSAGAKAATSAQTPKDTQPATSAQPAKSVNAGLQEIRFGAGVRGAVDRTLRNGSPEIFSLSYARYNQKGLGFRTGIEYMPVNMKIDSYFGVPVAFSARTGARSFSQSLRTGLESAAVGAVRDAVYGYEPNAGSILGDFFLGLFNRAEFFAGLTPGYIFGTNTPYSTSYSGLSVTEETVKVANRFTLSADAGFSMSFRIWRFNLSIVPAVHYFLTKNYIYVKGTTPVSDSASPGSSASETPVRFQYSVLGALGFSF